MDVVLRGGGYEAAVSSIGASLRMLRDVHGDLVLWNDADAPRPAMSGATLAPWPNRIAQARYVFDGVEHELPVTEPGRAHALHGLVADAAFVATERASDAVTLAAEVLPQPGYPWHVGVEVHVAVGPTGLRQEVRAINLGTGVAPVGLGGHPYLVAAGPLAGWRLSLPADEVLLLGSDLIPVGAARVARHPDLDFRVPRAVGAFPLNHAFGDLRADPDGRIRATLVDGSGVGVEISWTPDVPWVQLYSLELDGRGALAVEPMTCPPDAFNSHQDLRRLAPGESTSASWLIARATPSPLD